MAVRFERLGPFQDQDFHLQLSDSADWRASKHIIAEVAPGEAYRQARNAIWQLVTNEDPKAGRTHIFRSPPRIEVIGFLFFDDTHARRKDCLSPGGRGIRDANRPNMVQGVWELHPVIAIWNAAVPAADEAAVSRINFEPRSLLLTRPSHPFRLKNEPSFNVTH